MSPRLSHLSAIFTGSALALLGLVMFQQGADLPNVAGENLAQLLTPTTQCADAVVPTVEGACQ